MQTAAQKQLPVVRSPQQRNLERLNKSDFASVDKRFSIPQTGLVFEDRRKPELNESVRLRQSPSLKGFKKDMPLTSTYSQSSHNANLSTGISGSKKMPFPDVVRAEREEKERREMEVTRMSPDPRKSTEMTKASEKEFRSAALKEVKQKEEEEEEDEYPEEEDQKTPPGSAGGK